MFTKLLPLYTPEQRFSDKMPKTSDKQRIKALLEEKVRLYNTPNFIPSDPISIPHRFSLRQDREIMGFFASIFAWGQRKTIISKSLELSQRMDDAPFDFVKNHQEADLKALHGFKHRTFNDTDLLYCIDFMHRHFAKHSSLETAFCPVENSNTETALTHFHRYFFASPHAPTRTAKHIPTPQRKSACKRLNMFLRWMVRCDSNGVDFGMWTKLKPVDLVCPLDLHVERTARKLGLLTREKADWQAATELTTTLREFDATDPVKYDFALFGLSVEGKLPFYYTKK